MKELRKKKEKFNIKNGFHILWQNKKQKSIVIKPQVGLPLKQNYIYSRL